MSSCVMALRLKDTDHPWEHCGTVGALRDCGSTAGLWEHCGTVVALWEHRGGCGSTRTVGAVETGQGWGREKGP